MDLPQEGHMGHLLKVFSYLRKYHSSGLVLDPNNPVIDISLFGQKYWTSSDFGNIDVKE